MGTQPELDTLLKACLPEGEKNTYFQPTANVLMKYPCIVYAQNDEDVAHADNRLYRRVKRWEITVIDRDPTSEIPDVIAALPMSRWNRRFVKDNLNHTVYNLFF